MRTCRGTCGGLVALSATENCLSLKLFAHEDYRMLNNFRDILNTFLQKLKISGMP